MLPANASIHWVRMPDVPPILGDSKLILKLFLLLIYLMRYGLMVPLFSYSSVINFNFGLFIRVRIINWGDWQLLLRFLGLMKSWFDIYRFTDWFLRFKTRKDSFDKIMRWIPSNCFLLFVVECFTWITMRFFVIENQRGCGSGYLSRLWYVPWSF